MPENINPVTAFLDQPFPNGATLECVHDCDDVGKGLRTIVELQGVTVREIMHKFAGGQSPRVKANQKYRKNAALFAQRFRNNSMQNRMTWEELWSNAPRDVARAHKRNALAELHAEGIIDDDIYALKLAELEGTDE